MSDPASMTLAEAARAVASGKISSRALVEACLARIARWQPRLNAFIEIEAEAARRAADAADAEVKEGRRLGALHGVPLAHKDMFYRQGRVSACGSPIRRDWVAATTSTAIARLAQAGALHLGRLGMAEWAFGPTGHNYHFGHCRNPWNTEHMTGGSSSGAGAAVAARLAFGALGSDTGGSIRLPAAACGLSGLKPTYGLVSRAGAMPLSFSVDTVGPLARTVEDCALLTAVIAGPDPADPTTHPETPPDYAAALGRGVRGLVVGAPDAYFVDGVADEVRAAIDAAIAAFGKLGAKIVAARMPDLDAVNAFGQIVIATEAAAAHGPWLRTRAGDYSAQVLARLEQGFATGAVEYIDSLRARGRELERFLGLAFAEADVLIAPVLSMPVPTIAATDVAGSADMARVLGEITRLTRPVNYLGLPALSLPIGFDRAGLPVGAQLIGRPFAEATLFAAGHAYQQATDWHRRAPAE